MIAGQPPEATDCQSRQTVSERHRRVHGAWAAIYVSTCIGLSLLSGCSDPKLHSPQSSDAGAQRADASSGAQTTSETSPAAASSEDAGEPESDAADEAQQGAGPRAAPGPTADGPRLEGRVLQADTLARVSNATVTGPHGSAVRSDADGRFQLPWPQDGRGVLRVSAPGYARVVEPLAVSNPREAGKGSYRELRLPRLTFSTSIDAAEPAAVASDDGTRAEFDRGAFVTRDGKPVTGKVSVELTALDPSNPNDLAAFPGDFSASNDAGIYGIIEAISAVGVVVRQNNAALSFAPDKGAELSFPIPAALAARAPETIGLWFLDETTGHWVEEGLATRTRDAAGRAVYRARIYHMSFWSCDQLISSTCIRGCVERDKKRVAAQVQVQGATYGYADEVATDADGCFATDVKPNDGVLLRAYASDTASAWKAVAAPTQKLQLLRASPGDAERVAKCSDVGTLELTREVSNSDGCPAGLTRCGDRCVALELDPQHCGACDARCASEPAAMCVAARCQCPKGYSGDGTRCSDDDECQDNHGGCAERAQCRNTPGSFTCSCEPGYAGDGKTCTDIDECASGRGGCDRNARCENTPGGFRCACNSGFLGDGTRCEPIPEFRVTGSLSGLPNDASLQLSDGTDVVTLSQNGAFEFPSRLRAGASYTVSVVSAPASYTCSVSQGAGLVSADIMDIAVTCTMDNVGPYRIAGTVTGLGAGFTLTLELNQAETLVLTANTAFEFGTRVARGEMFAVRVVAVTSDQGSGQATCEVVSGSGVATFDTSDVVVRCDVGGEPCASNSPCNARAR